jgi:hypothetical protein
MLLNIFLELVFFRNLRISEISEISEQGIKDNLKIASQGKP